MIDETMRKIFAQLDDPATAANALDLLRARLARQGLKFSHLAADLADAVPLRRYQELEQEHAAQGAELQKWQQANAQCQAGYNQLEIENRQLRAENARLRWNVPIWRRAWYAVHYRPRARRAICGGVLALALIGGGYELLREPPMSPAAREQLVTLRLPNWSVGEDSPVVVDLAGAPWWVKIDRDVDSSSYVDRFGRAVSLNCYHFFARPAVKVFGSYEKPGPDDDWGEREHVCVPPQTASK